MYSLIVVWSLCVIVRLARLRELSRMRRDSNKGSLRRQTGLRAVQKRFARVLVACMFIARASPVKCDSVAHIKRLHVYHRLSSPRRPYKWSYG